jgi:TRAP-type C4-dicarboxylate transport system substrate-binding protein
MLKRLILTASLLVSGAAAHSQSYELKVSHYLPPNHTVQKVLEDWSAELEQKSQGQLKLRIYPATQLGPVPRQFDLARNGQADMAVGLTGATPGRYPLTEIGTLPFASPSAGLTSAAMSRRMTELTGQYLAPEFAGLRVLWFGIAPPTSFFTARKQINTVADLSGLKLRFLGEQQANVLRALGAVPLQVPPGEIADGMAKGVIDGAMFNYEAAESFGLGTVTHHVMEPAFFTGALALVMNAGKYQSLPANLRTLIDETTGPAAAEQLGVRWDAADAHGRAAMLAAHVEINTLDPQALAEMHKAIQPLIDDAIASVEKDGKPAKAFFAAYTK